MFENHGYMVADRNRCNMHRFVSDCDFVSSYLLFLDKEEYKYFSSCLDKKAPTPCLSGAIIKPAMPMRPFFGIDPVLVDEKVIHS